MRAFASILLAAALLFPLLLFISEEARMDEAASTEFADVRAAETNYYAGEDIRNAVFAVMTETARERMPRDARSVRETQVEIGERLAGLEAFVEQEYAKEGVQADVWCGAFSEEERMGLVGRMAREGKPLKCERCFDASKIVIVVGAGGRAEPVPACAFFSLVEPALLLGGRVGAGNALLSIAGAGGTGPQVPVEFERWDALAGANVAIGVSIYDERTGAASTAYVEGGEMHEY